MSTTPTPSPSKKPTPKVAAQGITALIITVVLGAIAAINPQLLSFLGPWSVVVYAAIVALGGFLAGYIKKS